MINTIKDFLKIHITRKFLTSLTVTLTTLGLLTIIYLNLKHITVNIDGKETKIVTFKNTVEKALAEKKISVAPKDKIEPAMDAKVKNKDTIKIKRAVNIIVAVDDEERSIQSAEEDIDAMLKAEGITLRELDKLSLDKETKLEEGMKLDVIRVDKRLFSDITPIDFETVVKPNGGLPNTYRKIVQEGKEGEKKISTSVTYENGKEVDRKVLEETTFKKPVDKIIVQGTYPLMPISRGGDPVPYSKVVRMRATAYSAVRGIGRTYTATGRLAVRNPEGYSTIAVDPGVIPYGTKLFVEGYGFAIAADTGSAIVGNTIDVFFDTYQESVNWAVKYVNVYVLK